MSSDVADAITRENVVSGLRRLGLLTGSKVLVHSSLSSFGHVEGGAKAVIDALLEAAGPLGTVMVPTLTGDEALSPDNPPRFDPDATPCWTGAIPETFRKRPGAVRSLHPTHSVAAIGQDASAMTRDHWQSITPCDEASPYGKLARDSKGCVLLIGASYQTLTILHHVEEIAGVDYHVQDKPVRAEIVQAGERFFRHYLLHRYGTPREFGVLEPLIVERGLQAETMVGKSRLRLIRAQGLVDVALRCVRANARFLCAE